MEPNTSTFESDVQKLMQALPQPIQDFLKSAHRNTVIAAIVQKHKLRADQAGTFEREFIFMLLGMRTQEEFLAALSEAAVPDDSINEIVDDINTLVFKPLQEKVLKPPAPVARPVPAPPANLPGASPQAGMIHHTSLPKPPAEALLSDHEEPHIAIGVSAPPVAAVPAPRPAPAPLPAQALRPRILPPLLPPAAPALNPLPPGAAAKPIVKQYGADPYREPIDGK